MKSLIALVFATVTFAVFTAPAEARHNFCHRYPDDPRCAAINDGYDEFSEDDEEDVYIERRRPRRIYEEPRPRRVDRSCEGIARWLAYNGGYRRIRATDCGGRNFGYEAVRGGWLYIIKVDSQGPRIKSEFRLRRY
jgi:hypothetical protein